MAKRKYSNPFNATRRASLMSSSVVQRQACLMSRGLSNAAAYDTARKEFYRLRHSAETETRVAKEEALATGAFFGPGPLEVGMKLEDQQYEAWKTWAAAQIAAMKQLQGSAYTGMENEDAAAAAGGGDTVQEDLQEVSESIPASRAGLEARGGAAVHA